MIVFLPFHSTFFLALRLLIFNQGLYPKEKTLTNLLWQLSQEKFPTIHAILFNKYV